MNTPALAAMALNQTLPSSASLNDAVVLIDPNTHKITAANSLMREISGVPLEELIGKELFEIGLLKNKAAGRRIISRLKKGQEVSFRDLRFQSSEGLLLQLEMDAILWQGNGGSIIACNFRDGVQRKKQETALMRLAAIVQSSDDAIIGKDLRGIITDWNQGAENIFGYSASEIIGSSIKRLIPSDRFHEETEILSKVKAGVGVQHFETVRRTKSGRLIDVSVTTSPIRDSKGEIVGASKVARDISGRKRVEEALRRNEAFFSAVVAQMPLGVFVVDAELRLIQANLKALPLFTHIEPLIGRGLSEIMAIVWPRRAAAQIVRRFQHTFKTGEPCQLLNFAERRLDIKIKEIYEWQIQRVTFPAGKFGVVCFFNNITERKRAEGMQRRLDVLTLSNRRLNEEVQRRQAVEKRLKKSEQHQIRLLEQSREMQGQLRHLSQEVLRVQEEERKRISRELHDIIGQTLTGINIRLANLKKASKLNTRDFQKSIDSTRRLVEDSVNIVHQFARELRPTVLDDLGLIPALHAFMKNFTARTGIRTSLTVFADVEKLGASRRTTLFRVAQEALTNVSRHAEASRVEVIIQKQPGWICMQIKDDGKSFDVKGTLRAKGTQHLGMLGMRERLEMISGSLHVESAPEQGTLLEARIPFRRPRVAKKIPLTKQEKAL